jgi:uncharacterized damage-inducible protein DinB
MRTLSVFATLWLVGAAGAFAQSSSGSAANPLTSGSKAIYGITKGDVLKAAEEMPEENYSFRPVGTVRTFGELVGHVADAQYEFCGPVAADGTKSPGVEKSKTGKADLIAALKEAFAYCDKTYDSMTDARGTETIKFAGRNFPKLSLLEFNNVHNMEHYGNMVTYLRIKALVPPSSQQTSR